MQRGEPVMKRETTNLNVRERGQSDDRSLETVKKDKK